MNKSAKRKVLHAHAYRALLNRHCGMNGHTNAVRERGNALEANSTDCMSGATHHRVDSEVKQDNLPSTEVDKEAVSCRTRDVGGEMASCIKESQDLDFETDGKMIPCELSNSPLPVSPHFSLGEKLADFKFASEIKSAFTEHEEYWVPIRLSNVQLEQYCSTLIDYSEILCCNTKKEVVHGLHDISMTIRKCCDHPYLVDWSLESIVNRNRPTVDYLDTGIQVSGKLQLLDRFLPLIKERGLRVLILFQTGSHGKKDVDIGDILDDFVYRKFGEDSYVHIYADNSDRSKNQEALNSFNGKSERFVILMERSSCHPRIKISSLDFVILFNNDWDPLNDIKSIRKITLEPQFDHVKIFRLFVTYTVEEKALVLAKEGMSLDSKINCLSYRACHMLLIWRVKYLFGQLSDFHNRMTSASSLVICSEQDFLLNVLSELSSILSCHAKGGVVNFHVISKVSGNYEYYPMDISLPGEIEATSSDEMPAHVFWGDLFAANHPCWKFLPDPSDKLRKRVQLLDCLPHDFEGEKDSIMKCGKMTDIPDLQVILNPGLGPRRKRNARNRGNKLAVRHMDHVMVVALKASSVPLTSLSKGTSVTAGAYENSAPQEVQSSSCLVNHGDGSSYLVTSKTERGILRKRKRSLGAERNKIFSQINGITKVCERKLRVVLQKHKEEIQDFFRATREEKEMLKDEHNLESSLIYGETAAEQTELKQLDQNFKEKLSEHNCRMEMKRKKLEAKHLAERSYEKSSREKWLALQQKKLAGAVIPPGFLPFSCARLMMDASDFHNGPIDLGSKNAINLGKTPADLTSKICCSIPTIECQHFGEVQAGSGISMVCAGDKVSPSCSAQGLYTLSLESNGENDLVVMFSEKGPDFCREKLGSICNLGASEELDLVPFSEKVTEEVKNVSEKKQDNNVKELNDPDNGLQNKPVISIVPVDDLFGSPQNVSHGMLVDEKFSSMVPLIVLTDSPDCEELMNLDRADAVFQQPLDEPSPTDIHGLKTGEMNSVPMHMPESWSLPVEQPTMPAHPPCPAVGPNNVSVHKTNYGCDRQVQAFPKLAISNLAFPCTVSSSSVPIVSSEKVTEEVRNASEKERDNNVEELSDLDNGLQNETMISLVPGNNLSGSPQNVSHGMLVDDKSSSTVPVIELTDSDPDCEELLNLDRADDMLWQPSDEPSPTDIHGLKTGERNSAPMQTEVQMAESSLLPVEQLTMPACPPCPTVGPNDASTHRTNCQSNGVDGFGSQHQAFSQSAISNLASPYTVSSSSSPIVFPLCAPTPLLLPIGGQCFPNASMCLSGTSNNMPPSPGREPLQVELERLQREEEESVKKHQDTIMLLQAACEKEIEEIRRKYEVYVKGIDAALLEKKRDIKTRSDVTLSHMILAKSMKIVASVPELSLDTRLKNPPVSPSVPMNQSQWQPFRFSVQCCPQPKSSSVTGPPQVVNNLSELLSANMTMPYRSTVVQATISGYHPQAPAEQLHQRPHRSIQPPPAFPSAMDIHLLGIYPLERCPGTLIHGPQRVGDVGGLLGPNGCYTS